MRDLRCVAPDGALLAHLHRHPDGTLTLVPEQGPPLTIRQPSPGAPILVHRADELLGTVTPEDPTFTTRTFTARLGSTAWTVTANAFATRYRVTTPDDALVATATHPVLSSTLTLTTSEPPTLLLAALTATRAHRPAPTAYTPS
ncbi:hypothetical protein LO762_11315 [Actinocorallia sp. API 0066]|uniref:hypothetical protein n=1 Tax=Actinocorallia sp. API 0066 TaxID=2896846 RepID=UPI001E5BEE79|nr:hypothetical protein [Actinocorallia sp. API 0066]MCD0449773.1 hypothetical protein [Actinocorallia sp. API 0066]